MKKRLDSVRDYIQNSPPKTQATLKLMHHTILHAAPKATERISYGMPYYDYKGRLAYFRLSKTHIGLYLPPPVIEQHKKELAQYSTARATVRFALNKKLPIKIITKLIKARLIINKAKKK